MALFGQRDGYRPYIRSTNSSTSFFVEDLSSIGSDTLIKKLDTVDVDDYSKKLGTEFNEIKNLFQVSLKNIEDDIETIY